MKDDNKKNEIPRVSSASQPASVNPSTILDPSPPTGIDLNYDNHDDDC